MKSLLTTLLLLLLGATTAAGQTPVSLSPATLAPLRVVPRAVFCASLTGSFVRYAEVHGYDQIQSALLVSVGVGALVAEMKAGRAQAYLSTTALAQLASLPNKAPEGGLVPLSTWFGPALGVKSDSTLALSASELRFLPFAQRGLDVIVLARDGGELTEERALKVAAAARELGVRVSSVWAGAETDAPEGAAGGGEARILAWLAATTGGSFTDLSGRGNPCAPRL